MSLVETALIVFIVAEQYLFHNGQLGRLTVVFSYATTSRCFCF